MATKKTEKSAPKAKTTKAAPAATKTAKAPKAAKPAVKAGPRHPKARVTEAHGGKAELAKALAPALVRTGEDAAQIESKLKTASNQQLLRLQRTVKRVNEKWGNREALITAIGTAQKKSKDKDYLAKLGTYSLPQLLDLGVAAERRARA